VFVSAIITENWTHQSVHIMLEGFVILA